MGNRKKITFGSINKGNFKIIPPEEVSKSRKRISKNMEKVIREFKKKEWESIQYIKNKRIK